MIRRLERWKPAAPARTQVLLAALLWTGVGLGLSTAGVHWIWRAGGYRIAALTALGAALGLTKARLALDRTAGRIAARIAARGDGTCAGGFLSWKSWLFVGAMMALGATLRRSPLPRVPLGVLYTAVGVALLWGSRVFWLEWRGPA
ncbi:MAG: hypothetical protein Kow0092_11190 [Deferrisomatales bacterium]